jgi:hypothetical protein
VSFSKYSNQSTPFPYSSNLLFLISLYMNSPKARARPPPSSSPVLEEEEASEIIPRRKLAASSSSSSSSTDAEDNDLLLTLPFVATDNAPKDSLKNDDDDDDEYNGDTLPSTTAKKLRNKDFSNSPASRDLSSDDSSEDSPEDEDVPAKKLIRRRSGGRKAKTTTPAVKKSKKKVNSKRSSAKKTSPNKKKKAIQGSDESGESSSDSSSDSGSGSGSSLGGAKVVTDSELSDVTILDREERTARKRRSTLTASKNKSNSKAAADVDDEEEDDEKRKADDPLSSAKSPSGKKSNKGKSNQNLWTVDDELREEKIEEARSQLRTQYEERGIDYDNDADMVDGLDDRRLVESARLAFADSPLAVAALATIRKLRAEKDKKAAASKGLNNQLEMKKEGEEEEEEEGENKKLDGDLHLEDTPAVAAAADADAKTVDDLAPTAPSEEQVPVLSTTATIEAAAEEEEEEEVITKVDENLVTMQEAEKTTLGHQPAEIVPLFHSPQEELDPETGTVSTTALSEKDVGTNEVLNVIAAVDKALDDAQMDLEEAITTCPSDALVATQLLDTTADALMIEGIARNAAVATPGIINEDKDGNASSSSSSDSSESSSDSSESESDDDLDKKTRAAEKAALAVHVRIVGLQERFRIVRQALLLRLLKRIDLITNAQVEPENPHLLLENRLEEQRAMSTAYALVKDAVRKRKEEVMKQRAIEMAENARITELHFRHTSPTLGHHHQLQQQQQQQQPNQFHSGVAGGSPNSPSRNLVFNVSTTGASGVGLTSLTKLSDVSQLLNTQHALTQDTQLFQPQDATGAAKDTDWIVFSDDDDDDDEEEEEDNVNENKQSEAPARTSQSTSDVLVVDNNFTQQIGSEGPDPITTSTSVLSSSLSGSTTVDAEKAVDQQALSSSSSSSSSSPPPATTLPVYTGPSVAHIEKIMKILDDEFQAQDEQLIKLAREAKEAYKREKDKYIARRLHVLLKRREEKSKSRILMGLESEDSDQEEIDKKALREQIEQEELNNEELNAILLSNYLPSMLREMSKVTDSIRSGGGGGGGSSSSSNDATATAYATAAAAHDVLARRAHSELGRLNAAIAPNSSDSFINSSSSNSGRVSSKHISSDKQRKLLRSELQIAQMRLTSQVQARQDNLKFNDMAAKLIASARGMLNKNKNERDRELRAKLIAAKIATGVLDKLPAPSPEETVVTSSEIVEEMAEEGDDEEESDDEGGENGGSDDDEDDSDYNEEEEKEEEEVKEKQVHDAEMTTSSSASALDDSLIDVRTSSSSEVAMNNTDAPLLKSSSSSSSSASIIVDNSKTAIPSAVSLDSQNDEIAHSVEEVPQASIKKTSAAVVSSGPLAKMFAVQEKKAIALKEKKEAKIAKAAKVKAVKGASSSSSSGAAAAEDDEVLQISEDEDALERLLAREHGEDDDDDDEEEEEEEEDDEEEVVEKPRVKSRLTRFSKLEKGNDDDDASSVSSSDIAKKTTIHASTEESDDDFEEEAENVSDSDVSSLQPTTTTTATTQKLVIFDDEDEEYEKQREAERLKLEAEEEEAERLANPKTFLDMIRAEDAEARNRGGKGSRRNRHIEQEAELSEDDDAVGLDQFGAQNQLLGNDRKLVTKIIEEEEEKREALLDEKALKELQAAVVDEVDETEKALDGQQASLFAMQREAEDRKLETKVKKAVARGEHQSLLRGKRKRRGGREGGSDSEDAADEEDGENELNAVEKMRKRMGQEYIVEDEEEEEDEDDDEEGDEEGVSSDTDEDFDFEAAMKKRTKEERLAAAAERERDLGDIVDEDGRLKKRSSWRKGGGDSQRGLTQEVQEDERDVEARAALTQVNTAIKSVVDIFTNRGNEEDDEDDEEEEEEKKNDLHKKGIEKDLDKAAADHSNSRKGSGHFVEGNSNSNKNSSQVFSSSSSSSLRALSSTTSATTTTTGGASSTTIKDMFRSSSDPSRAAPPSLIAGATISSSSAAAISSNRGGSFFGNKLLMGSATAGVGGTAEPPLWRVPSLSANVSVPAIRVAIETASSSSSSSLSSSNPTPIAGSKSLGESVSIPQQQQQRSNSSEGNTPIAGATLLAMPQQQQQQHSSKSRGEDSMRPPPSRNPATVRNGGQLPSNFAGFLPRSNTLNAPGGLSALSSSTAPVQNPLKSTFALPLSEMISATAGVDSGLSRSAMPFLSSSDQFGGGGGGASSSAFFSASASGLSLGGRADSRIPSAFQPGFSASLGGFGVNSSSSSSSFSSSSFSSSSAANRGFVYGAGKSASTNGEAGNKRKRDDGKEGSNSDVKRQQR